MAPRVSDGYKKAAGQTLLSQRFKISRNTQVLANFLQSFLSLSKMVRRIRKGAKAGGTSRGRGRGDDAPEVPAAPEALAALEEVPEVPADLPGRGRALERGRGRARGRGRVPHPEEGGPPPEESVHFSSPALQPGLTPGLPALLQALRALVRVRALRAHLSLPTFTARRSRAGARRALSCLMQKRSYWWSG